MPMALAPLTPSQVARAVGMGVEDVERYRALGLLQPLRRRRSGDAKPGYHQEHVDRLRFIQRALGYGFSLGTNRRLLDTETLLTCNDVYRITQAQIEELRLMQHGSSAALEGLAARCPQVGARQECPVLATLRDGASKA